MTKQRFSALLLVAAFLGLGAADNPAPPVQPLFPVALEQEFPKAEAAFAEVRDLILENYYIPDITPDALYWAAIEGMLRRISPPENPELGKLWAPAEYEKVKTALEGYQVSIGVKSSFNPTDGSLTVSEVMPGSPSEGVLEPLDRILRIDGRALRDMKVEEVTRLLEGEEGSQVVLTVNRDVSVKELTLTRKRFSEQNLLVLTISKEAAMITIRRFSLDISKELREKLTALQADGVHKVILDLRGNQGGVFVEALRVAELFVKEKGILLRTFDRKKKLQTYMSAAAPQFNVRLAVLVNRSSASASEIVAACLQDHRAAVVVGSKTVGKGVFESTYTLKNGYCVKFITGAMYTPAGRAWQGKGLTPDFYIDQDDKTVAALAKLPADERCRRDTALITALKLLARDDR